MKTDQNSQLKNLFGDIIDHTEPFSSDALNIHLIDTLHGQMVAISEQNAILLLEFTHRKNINKQLLKIKKITAKAIIPYKSILITQLEEELQQYFSGKIINFQIPINFNGTVFQKKVWSNLQKIPYGETISYRELAKMSGNDKAFRAVANANANNNIAIIVPCHRVVLANGETGGYAGGPILKQQLLLHEKNNLNKGR